MKYILALCCPDPANPCKHIGAVYYMLGDRFSEDPFVLFQLRGRLKEEIIAKLRNIRGSGGGKKDRKTSKVSPSVKGYEPPVVSEYWQYKQQLESSLVVISPPPGSETVLDVLGPIPLGTTATAADVVMQYLETIYKNVSDRAVLRGFNRESEG